MAKGCGCQDVVVIIAVVPLAYFGGSWSLSWSWTWQWWWAVVVGVGVMVVLDDGISIGGSCCGIDGLVVVACHGTQNPGCRGCASCVVGRSCVHDTSARDPASSGTANSWTGTYLPTWVMGRV